MSIIQSLVADPADRQNLFNELWTLRSGADGCQSGLTLLDLACSETDCREDSEPNAHRVQWYVTVDLWGAIVDCSDQFRRWIILNAPTDLVDSPPGESEHV